MTAHPQDQIAEQARAAVGDVPTPEVALWRSDVRAAALEAAGLDHDPVHTPSHYRSHPSGVECLDVVEHFDFCRGNVIKYVWRAGLKGGLAQELEDLEKAAVYLGRAIAKLRREQGAQA